MNKEYIEFKKERDLGSIITDAFKFIRLEGKSFFLTILKMAAIPIIITIITMIYWLVSFGGMLPGESDFPVIGLGLSGFLMVIAYIVAIIVINLSGMYYIKSYIDNNGNVKYDEININTKNKFWSFTGFGFLAMLIIFASMLLCVFPMFYTMTVLSLGASILVFENESATSTIGKCFSFITGHFWETFGVVIVVGLLVGILGSVFQIPAFIYQIIKMSTVMGNDDPSQIMGMYKDPIYLFLNLVSIVGKFVFYSITLITNVFIYFDINEQKNLTGTIEKIDSLGQ